VIGRISMDLVTVDVTEVPEDSSQPGAVVEVLGPNLPPDDLAERARTNGYEIMTALGRRYHRAYVDSQGDAAGEEA
jgi:alanine racemase